MEPLQETGFLHSRQVGRVQILLHLNTVRLLKTARISVVRWFCGIYGQHKHQFERTIPIPGGFHRPPLKGTE